MIAEIHRDHGGDLDAAIGRFGGKRGEWLDLSTGINPVSYPVPKLPVDCWASLPDTASTQELELAARRFWQVPEAAAVVAAPGVSALIARIPELAAPNTLHVNEPTYSEFAAAFEGYGWRMGDMGSAAKVVVHPNNPDGRWQELDGIDSSLLVVDESFCDVAPERSHIAAALRPGTLILKGLGKFWGLAGLRLGFAMGDPALIKRLAGRLGPWPVSGPALVIGTAALNDPIWAEATRNRLAEDAKRLDAAMTSAGASVVGGTALFRLFDVDDALAWQVRFARHRIWTRTFAHSRKWLRLGLPHPDSWERFEAAL